MSTRKIFLVCFTVCLQTIVSTTHYPANYYLNSQCKSQILFQESMLVSYSLNGYTTIPPNYNCLLTIVSPGRGIQVRFRKLQTTYSLGCSHVKLLVYDKSGPLTPTSGVCGVTSPQTMRTTKKTVFVKLITDNTTTQYGDFELLFTEFTGNCTSADFKCNNGICISADLKCNGYNDCDDDSDEIEGCRLTSLTLSVIVGIAFAIICFFIFVCVFGGCVLPTSPIHHYSGINASLLRDKTCLYYDNK